MTMPVLTDLQVKLIRALRSYEGRADTAKLALAVGTNTTAVGASLSSLKNKDPRLTSERAEGEPYTTWQWAPAVVEARDAKAKHQCPASPANVTTRVRIKQSAVSAPNNRVTSPVAGKSGVAFVYQSGDLVWVINPDSGALCCVWDKDVIVGAGYHLISEPRRLGQVDMHGRILELQQANAALSNKVRELESVDKGEQPLTPVCFMVFNPKHSKPPRVKFTSADEAANVAREMAQRYPGQAYHVIAVLPGVSIEAVPQFRIHTTV